MSGTYADLLSSRFDWNCASGFEPVGLPEQLFDFQKFLVDWAVRKGRGAIFADCGMGKTAMQLAWAQNVIEKTNKHVLVLTPLAVAGQTKREAEKFGFAAAVARDGQFDSSPSVVITNYERLHYFDHSKFGGVVCDESSCIKSFDSARKDSITEFFKKLKYRLLCTATAAPNDYFELGTSSEALGYLGARDMITTFFVQETERDELGWGRTKYRLRGHAEHPFWRWVCSWARALRSPSDFGFDASRFILPDLKEKQVIVDNSTPRGGMLFSTPAVTLGEQREERRITLHERCELVASLVEKAKDSAVIWCHLNDEANELERIIPDALQVSGSMSDDEKEERLNAFSTGQLRVLVTKPKIGCWGLNWQHCNRVFTFPSHSFEQYYQAIRRCWRFGQKRPVHVTIVTTEGEAGILANLKRKSEQASAMFDNLVMYMKDELAIESFDKHTGLQEVPAWL